MAWVATAPITSVVPSGGDFATASAPRLPPAPGRLSTMTTPSVSLTLSASARATMSSGPPGGYGTTRRMGLPCARAGRAMKAAIDRRRVRRLIASVAMLVGFRREGVRDEVLFGQPALCDEIVLRRLHHDRRPARIHLVAGQIGH